MMLAVPKQKPLLINFFNIANSFRQVKDNHRELLVIMRWGGEEEYNSEPNIFWYNYMYVYTHTQTHTYLFPSFGS